MNLEKFLDIEPSFKTCPSRHRPSFDEWLRGKEFIESAPYRELKKREHAVTALLEANSFQHSRSVYDWEAALGSIPIALGSFGSAAYWFFGDSPSAAGFAVSSAIGYFALKTGYFFLERYKASVRDLPAKDAQLSEALKRYHEQKPITDFFARLQQL